MLAHWGGQPRIAPARPAFYAFGPVRYRRTAGFGLVRAVLLASALAFGGQARAVNLSVDATRTVRTVDERVFGVNMVIWDQAGSTAQTISLLQTAGLRTLRFPGGSLSDTYVWSANKSYDTTTGQLNTWSWFTSFPQFCSVVTGLNPPPQAFITANYGSGTPQMAAAWVAYANASATLAGTGSDVMLGVDSRGTDWKTAGYWSALRAAAPLAADDGLNFLRLGRSSPFGLKYWEIGNECYGTWEYDTHPLKNDPYTYALAARNDLQHDDRRRGHHRRGHLRQQLEPSRDQSAHGPGPQRLDARAAGQPRSHA